MDGGLPPPVFCFPAKVQFIWLFTALENFRSRFALAGIDSGRFVTFQKFFRLVKFRRFGNLLLQIIMACVDYADSNNFRASRNRPETFYFAGYTAPHLSDLCMHILPTNLPITRLYKISVCSSSSPNLHCKPDPRFTAVSAAKPNLIDFFCVELQIGRAIDPVLTFAIERRQPRPSKQIR